MSILPPEIPGFVWAYRFLPEHGAMRLASDTTLDQLCHSDGFVWLISISSISGWRLFSKNSRA
jgi:zinc transporter